MPDVGPGWTLGHFGCVGCARAFVTLRHRAASAIPECYRRHGRQSARKSNL